MPIYKGVSTDTDNLLEAQRLADNGIKELLVIAQDSTSYGWDLNPKSSLHELLDVLDKVNNLDKDMKKIYIKGVTEFGKGGMNTKIEAAKICNLAGCNMIIANGLYLNPIQQIEKKNICTLFESRISKLHARKKWIISSVSPKGTLVIDDGAKKALVGGKSLLAAGIINLSGKFNKGDHIKILDTKNKEFARGLSSFSSEEINKIMGCHSNEIEKKLGYITKSEVVHKDDMVEV